MAHPKGLLMERLKKQGVGQPEFRTANTGPDHEPTFLTDVVVNGEVYGTGQGSTKREAERLAAEEALAYLDRNPLELEGAAQGTVQDRKAESAPRSGGKKKAKAKAKPADEPEVAKPEAAAKPQAAGREAGHDLEPDRFEGPWPVFENLLAGIVEVAGERVDESLTGEEARVAVRDFTLELYKELLEDLGDIVEDGAAE